MILRLYKCIVIFLREQGTYLNFFFSNFFFLKVDTSLNMHDLNLKLHICVQSIVIEGTVSQIFFKIDSSLFIKFLGEKSKNYLKSCSFFDIKKN